jgi:hypothetical protein
VHATSFLVGKDTIRFARQVAPYVSVTPSDGQELWEVRGRELMHSVHPTIDFYLGGDPTIRPAGPGNLVIYFAQVSACLRHRAPLAMSASSGVRCQRCSSGGCAVWRASASLQQQPCFQSGCSQQLIPCAGPGCARTLHSMSVRLQRHGEWFCADFALSFKPHPLHHPYHPISAVKGTLCH